jgi:hypothetical protein
MTTIDFPSASWPVTIRRDARDIGNSFEKFFNQNQRTNGPSIVLRLGTRIYAHAERRRAESPMSATQERFIEAFYEVWSRKIAVSSEAPGWSRLVPQERH